MFRRASARHECPHRPRPIGWEWDSCSPSCLALNGQLSSRNRTAAAAQTRSSACELQGGVSSLLTLCCPHCPPKNPPEMGVHVQAQGLPMTCRLQLSPRGHPLPPGLPDPRDQHGTPLQRARLALFIKKENNICTSSAEKFPKTEGEEKEQRICICHASRKMSAEQRGQGTRPPRQPVGQGSRRRASVPSRTMHSAPSTQPTCTQTHSNTHRGACTAGHGASQGACVTFRGR